MQEKEKILEDYDFLVAETDEGGFINYMSQSLCHMVEHEMEDLTGKHYNDIIHPHMAGKLISRIWDEVKRGSIWSGYLQYQTNNKNYYWAYTTIFPFLTHDKKNAFITCSRKASTEEIRECKQSYNSI